MMLDPRDRKNWLGFIDLLRPPAGYRLSAALGTTFGLSFDALTAALLSLSGADDGDLARDPVAGVIAVTQLRNRVRVLLHPATISGSAQTAPTRLVNMFDRFLTEVRPQAGLFHPKVWALRFERVTSPGTSERDEIGRIVVGSRNLTASRCFELGAIFEGTPADAGVTPSLATDVADAISAWLKAASGPIPQAVQALPSFLRRLGIDVPHEAREKLRFHWQGLGGKPLSRLIPPHCDRITIVAPFVRSDFLSDLLRRSRELTLVSIPQSLDGLDDATWLSLKERAIEQGAPAAYQVEEHGDPEGAYIEGLHAKALLAEGGTRSISFVGSANATGPGWGSGDFTNVEAMLELSPGVTVDKFVKAFVRETKDKPYPWIREYARDSSTEPDSTEEASRRLLLAIRSAGAVELAIDYNNSRQQIRLSRASEAVRTSALSHPEFDIELTPLSLAMQDDSWRPFRALDEGPVVFDGVKLEELTAFVVIRGRCAAPPVDTSRILLARLRVSETDLDRRDELVREHLLAHTDPAAVLRALINGLARFRGANRSSRGPGVGGGKKYPVHVLLSDTSLERVLRAVAEDPTIISDLRLLVGFNGDESFHRFCDDLENATETVRREANT